MKIRLTILTIAVLAILSALGIHDETPEVREWDITHRTLPNLKIALLSDFHFSDPEDLERLSLMKRQLLHHNPDLILYAGDYIGSHSIYDSIGREIIVDALEALAYPKPVMAVLGNHDNWDSHEAWSDAFNNSSISLLENQVATVRVNGMDICIRGLGDFYSGYHMPTQIPKKCEGITLTLTHDPQGLLVETGELTTISFAGHTHCGQIALPIIGAPIVPTSAPKAAHCGRFEIGHIGITSGGLGTSIIPIRFGPNTEPGWELIQIQQLK